MPSDSGSIPSELKSWLAQCRGAEERVRFFIERDQDFKLHGTRLLTCQKRHKLDLLLDLGRHKAVLGIPERSVFSIGSARGAREVLPCMRYVRQVLTHPGWHSGAAISVLHTGEPRRQAVRGVLRGFGEERPSEIFAACC